MAVRLVAADRLDNELIYLEIGHESQLGTEGAKLHLQFSHTESKPGHTLRALEIESHSRSYKMRFSSPVIRSRDENLSLHAEFAVRDSETKISPTGCRGTGSGSSAWARATTRRTVSTAPT